MRVMKRKNIIRVMTELCGQISEDQPVTNS